MTWGALALALTVLGGGYTWWAFRHRGVAAGTRGAALTLLPPAAWLTGTLRMLTRIADAVGDWAVRLVFSPAVWAGVVLAGLSGVLFVLAGFLGRRSPTGSADGADRGRGPVAGAAERGRLGPAPAGRSNPVVDPELADIEAILKKRGIS